MVKTPGKLVRQMAARGWTLAQIDEARRNGERRPAFNSETDTLKLVRQFDCAEFRDRLS